MKFSKLGPFKSLSDANPSLIRWLSAPFLIGGIVGGVSGAALGATYGTAVVMLFGTIVGTIGGGFCGMLGGVFLGMVIYWVIIPFSKSFVTLIALSSIVSAIGVALVSLWFYGRIISCPFDNHVVASDLVAISALYICSAVAGVEVGHWMVIGYSRFMFGPERWYTFPIYRFLNPTMSGYIFCGSLLVFIVSTWIFPSLQPACFIS